MKQGSSFEITKNDLLYLMSFAQKWQAVPVSTILPMYLMSFTPFKIDITIIIKNSLNSYNTLNTTTNQ